MKIHTEKENTTSTRRQIALDFAVALALELELAIVNKIVACPSSVFLIQTFTVCNLLVCTTCLFKIVKYSPLAYGRT